MGILFEEVKQAKSKGYILGNSVGASMDKKTFEESLIKKGVSIFEQNKMFRKKNLAQMFESGSRQKQVVAARTMETLDKMNLVLENYKAMLGETTAVSNLGALAPRLFDVVGIFYPQIIAHELVDIQQIEAPQGVIYAWKPTYGNSYGNVNAGDDLYRTVSSTDSYASEDVFDLLGTADGSTANFTISLQAPVRPGSIKISAGSIGGVDNGTATSTTGSIVGTGISGTINYVTGALDITFTTAPAVGVVLNLEYQVNTELNTSRINTVSLQLTTITVKANAHPLKLDYSVESMLTAQSMLATNIGETLAEEAGLKLKKERDERLIRMLRNQAHPETSLNFDAQPTGQYARKDRYAEFEIKIDQARTLIQNRTGRGGVDYIVCGSNVANLVRQCTGFKAEPTANLPQVGSHKIGTLKDGTVSVIQQVSTLNSADAPIGVNEFVVGFKGYKFGDSSIILAEFVPLYMTPEFQNPNLRMERGLVSYYHLQPNNRDYLVKGSITNYEA